MNLKKLKWKRKKLTRDGFLFVFGVAGIVYETVAQHVDRPSLLFVFGACIGLPAFLHSDEKSVGPPAVPEALTPPTAPINPSPPSPAPSPLITTPTKRAPTKKTVTRKRAPAKKTAAKKQPPRRRNRTEE